MRFLNYSFKYFITSKNGLNLDQALNIIGLPKYIIPSIKKIHLLPTLLSVEFPPTVAACKPELAIHRQNNTATKCFSILCLYVVISKEARKKL